MEQEFKIDKRIRYIPDIQLRLLKEMWEFFLKQHEWPKGLLFRREHGREIVTSTLKDLSPLFIDSSSNDPRENYYRLTPQGVYAVEGVNGPSIRLILRYLDYLKKRFDEDSVLDKLTSKELEENLKFASEETRILGELLDRSSSTFPRLWGRTA